MTFTTVVTGFLLVTVYASLEAIELLNKREREEFENS